ncbi:HAD domain-containing protein, partial [Methylobacterium segetis]|uniref:HAD domain-containing protein n=1 Tax=Methylobacterium segetis TaxID=2488750 RepID=UPI00105147CC
MLFLDIDGVLNSRDCWERLRGSRHKIDREKVALLNEVVAATGCRIVVSSTWREMKRCRGILRDYGFKGRFCRDWRTPPTNYSAADPVAVMRGSEIEDWLSRNGRPPFAIVDDDSDMLPEQLPRFVQTSFEHGLTREHADRLIALLGPLHPNAARADALANGHAGRTENTANGCEFFGKRAANIRGRNRNCRRAEAPAGNHRPDNRSSSSRRT